MVEHAAKLKGRLQIIVGYNDPTCVLQHSLAFLRASKMPAHSPTTSSIPDKATTWPVAT